MILVRRNLFIVMVIIILFDHKLSLGDILAIIMKNVKVFHTIKSTICVIIYGITWLFVDDVHDFCKAHPSAVLPNPSNCAQYTNCSASVNNMHPMIECQYPDLFSSNYGVCLRFTRVKCDSRLEPQAPCEY